MEKNTLLSVTKRRTARLFQLLAIHLSNPQVLSNSKFVSFANNYI